MWMGVARYRNRKEGGVRAWVLVWALALVILFRFYLKGLVGFRVFFDGRIRCSVGSGKVDCFADLQI